jgi:hypothetical protein
MVFFPFFLPPFLYFSGSFLVFHALTSVIPGKYKNPERLVLNRHFAIKKQSFLPKDPL